MTRRNWLWLALVGVPVAVIGGLAHADTQKAKGYTCPLTGETLPCEKCCPLNGERAKAADGYTCPITGEQLPCEKCCPLNKTKATAKTDKPTADGYVCPVTGETLPCEKCCPLNKAKK
ncbi:MAG TPA: hypothetical protein VKE74_17130 [Gemmataceae bacterium]|nr:hypothetical protein [Gemmataceae bacterium]